MTRVTFEDEELFLSPGSFHMPLGAPEMPARPFEWQEFSNRLSQRIAHAYLVLPRTAQSADPQFWFPLLADVGASSPAAELDALIERARKDLLTLEAGWDDGDGQPYQPATIDRTAALIRRISVSILARGGELVFPAIRPAGEGSVDAYWSSDARTLLINVPEDAQVLATFSGRKSNGDAIAGRINLGDGRIAHLASWLG